MAQLREELAESRRESADLRQQLTEIRRQVLLTKELQPQPVSRVASPPPQVAQLAEDQELLAAKVEDQYQTKVESGSKYRVKLSGMALMTIHNTHGAAAGLDAPEVAETRGPGESRGAFGASLRQSIIGIDVEGPTLAGAKTHGEARADFFGGLPGTSEGTTSGLVRLRTAKLVLDWKSRTLEAGQDSPFISPLSPISLVTTAYPGLWAAGNLWAWTPQVHMTHRFEVSSGTKVLLQYGILDPLTGEIPPEEYERAPTAGERSRKPAVAFRLAGQRDLGSRQATAGVGMYYSRQNWGFERRVDSWAVTADWNLPVGRYFSFSGELYRGKALGGLGGGAGATVLMSGPVSSAATHVLPLDSGGGWAQLQFKPHPRWSVNGAFGGDFPFYTAAANALTSLGLVSDPKKNSSGFTNVIYQPRNNLLFSVEYRKLWTSPFLDRQRKAGQVGLGAAILF
ncbi:MAG: hypothetical protein U0Q16_17135 [Bryobacteraceae bacterium]